MAEHEHIVRSYEDELQQLTQSISAMGGLVEEAIVNSVEALTTLNTELAKKTSKGDKIIGQMQSEIDEQAALMIIRRQPMAVDLRQIIAAIRISSDLERAGDMAKNIARRTLAIDSQRLSGHLYKGLRKMSDLALRQLKAALDCYATGDHELAKDICRGDEEVDAYYSSLFREMLTYMMEDPRNITHCTHLLFCAKNLERVGDHATNIAEASYYLATGETLTLDDDDS